MLVSQQLFIKNVSLSLCYKADIFACNYAAARALRANWITITVVLVVSIGYTINDLSVSSPNVYCVHITSELYGAQSKFVLSVSSTSLEIICTHTHSRSFLPDSIATDQAFIDGHQGSITRDRLQLAEG